MFGILAVVYLFLGGVGAGVVVAVSLVDLLYVRQSFGARSHVSLDEATSSERILALALLAGFAALVLGTLCLVFDLGRVDRVTALFLNPSLSLLTVGSFALVILVVCAAVLVAARFLYIPAISRNVVVVVEIVAAIIDVVVMVYTGLLLQTLGGVAFWRSPLVPALFVLSSLSCGIAVVLIVNVFTEGDKRSMQLMRTLVCVDVVLIVLEALVAVAFVGLALGSDHPATTASAQQLVSGEAAALWWVGFAACGLVIPLVVEAATSRGFAGARTALAIAAVLVLVGGFSMRASIVNVGQHRALELESVSQQQTIDQSGAQALGSS